MKKTILEERRNRHTWRPDMMHQEEARLIEGEDIKLDRRPLGAPVSHLKRMLEHLEEQERKAKEECAYCKEHKGDSMMPPHTPSIHCESGRLPHCTCDICY